MNFQDKPFNAEYWNKCVRLLCRPIETLKTPQRLCALVFHYNGRIMNGGHELHRDCPGRPSHKELLAALKKIGALEHARIFNGVTLLWENAIRSYTDVPGAQEFTAELIESEFDRSFYAVKPDINELLYRYFIAHPESFPE